MTVIKFLHISDLHLGAPFKSAPKDLRNKLLNSGSSVLDSIRQYVSENSIDLIFISGDIFDIQKPSLKVQNEFYLFIKALSELNKKIFLIYGNHDHEIFKQNEQGYVSLKNFYTFSEDNYKQQVILNNKKLDIFGFNFSPNNNWESIYSIIKREADHNNLAFCLFHGEVSKNSDYNNTYGSIVLSNLRMLPINYWALGHLHNYDQISADPYVVYSGTTQGRSFKSSETNEKGGVEGRIDANGKISLKFVPFSKVDFLENEINYQLKSSDTLAIFNELIEIIKLSINNNLSIQSKDLIVRLILNLKLDDNLKISRVEIEELNEMFLNYKLSIKDNNIFISEIKWLIEKNAQNILNNQIEQICESILNESYLDSKEITDLISKPRQKIKGLPFFELNNLQSKILLNIKNLLN